MEINYTLRELNFYAIFFQGLFYVPEQPGFYPEPLVHRCPDPDRNIYRTFSKVAYENRRGGVQESKGFFVDKVFDKKDCGIGVITVTDPDCVFKPSDRVSHNICDVCCKDLLIGDADKEPIISPYKGRNYADIGDIARYTVDLT